MGKVTGFLEIDRFERRYLPAAERIRNYKEFVLPIPEDAVRDQGARCMDCGIPYCHNGCPVNNQIPDWNDLVYHGNWEEASRNLHSTNNFPEFTGRICPAPCEASCTLNLNDAPVTIKTIECSIVDHAFASGWIKPEVFGKKTGRKVAVVGSGPAGLACAQQLGRAGHEVHVFEKNGKRIAVIGSGPAGLACAQQLARMGHAPTVFEKNDRVGGLLRYGIPDFKMEKHLIDRRVRQMEAEGVKFKCNVNVGVDLKVEDLVKDYDAVVLAGGAEKPRDLPVPGRDLHGVHFAMDFLPQQNRRVSNEVVRSNDAVFATNKHVVVIGGGDTGSDCIGTSIRQGALSVTQLEIMSEPPVKENKLMTWPDWPLKLRTSSSHEEGASRDFAVLTKAFEGDRNGNVKALKCVKVDAKMNEIEGSTFLLKADLVLLAMGFVSPVPEGLLTELGVDLDKRGNVVADQKSYTSSVEKVWACGDMRRGQSLVVWAIREGRQAAHAVDKTLMGETVLPR